MALAFKAASGGQTATTATATSMAITLPGPATANDLVYFNITVGAVISAPVAAGWTLTLTTNATSAMSTIVGYRTIQTGDSAPTVTWTTAGKVAWSVITLNPLFGTKAQHFGFGTVLSTTTTATTATPNSFAAGTATGVSILLSGTRTSGTQTAALTMTPPTNWTEPASGDFSTTNATAVTQYAAEVSYRLAQTGTIAPGAETLSVTGYTIATHAFAIETPLSLPQPVNINQIALQRAAFY